MKKTKKLVALVLVAVLAITSVVGGTLAYFKDSEKATNTMSIGNVSIAQEELMVVGGQKVPFVDNSKNLYPYEYNKGMALGNKIVQTYNDSTSQEDVYIRVIVAQEWTGKDVVGFNFFVGEEGASYLPMHACNWNQLGVKAIDGKDYLVYECTVKGDKAVKYGEYVRTLQSVWFYEDVTQDDVKAFGEDGVQILVLSQGIQATGLSHAEAMTALGTIDETNLSAWF